MIDHLVHSRALSHPGVPRDLLHPGKPVVSRAQGILVGEAEIPAVFLTPPRAGRRWRHAQPPWTIDEAFPC